MRVAIVMPPATDHPYSEALDAWPTVVQQATALSERADTEVLVACRSNLGSGAVSRNGVPYLFSSSDAELVDHVRAWNPDVVHVHGFGFTRLTIRLGRAVHHTAAIVLQHHGEQPGPWRTVLGHRVARHFVDGYLLTGATFGQAQPFIDRGMIRKHAKCFEVLEAASTLRPDQRDDRDDDRNDDRNDDRGAESAPVQLSGTPVVLWVGRLIDSKDPLTALAAFGLSATALPNAHLHLLATDRTLEPEVHAAIRALGAVGERVHLHDAVAGNEMRGWYRAADIVFSTSWREGSGYSLIEAITEGCVPVATSIPSHRAIVGDLAPTFPPGEPAAAARLLAGATSIDASSVRVFATDHLSWKRVSAQLSYAYESVRHPRL